MVLARAKRAVRVLPSMLSYLADDWIVKLQVMTSLMQSSRMRLQANILLSLILFLQSHCWSSLPPKAHGRY